MGDATNAGVVNSMVAIIVMNFLYQISFDYTLQLWSPFKWKKQPEVVNLKKTFDGGKTYILNGLNLKIPSGKITVIIGFSGTGKSVLMKHILGLHRPTSGIIKVLGRDLTEMSDEDAIKLRIRMGVLFQHAALF